MGDELKLAAAMHRVFTSWQPKFLMASPTDLEMKPSWSRRKIVAQGRVDADTCAKNMAFLDLGDRRPSRHLTRMWGYHCTSCPPVPLPVPLLAYPRSLWCVLCKVSQRLAREHYLREGE
jgi:hypothetical protein